ncbi:hypothetical protein KIN20_012028 [Parelaphostrongylus tenuis]|uniref:Uncharacterized protein n=1 Tax=Parelaphostrongylus tenuis TaxID=148309 RepID=A0AAD5MVU6_PARTN|nr:hypothetical protein KIN20_012028 [Parelaphostrongylus tenuis]
MTDATRNSYNVEMQHYRPLQLFLSYEYSGFENRSFYVALSGMRMSEPNISSDTSGISALS